MSNRNTAQGGKHAAPPATDQTTPALCSGEADIEEGDDGYGIITRGRRRATHVPLQPQLPSLHNGPIPHFTPQTPSRTSGNPSKSASPSKTRRKQSTSPNKSQAGETGSTSSVGVKSRNQLAQMSPAITFHPTSALKDTMVPKPVVQFWCNYMASAVSATEVMPRERSVSRMSSDFASPADLGRDLWKLNTTHL